MTDRLTLNLGLRYEFYTLPTDSERPRQRRCGTSSPTRRSPSARRSRRTRRSATSRRASASPGTSPATAGPPCAAAPACITTPTARSTARSASRTSRRRSRRRRRSTTRRSRSRSLTGGAITRARARSTTTSSSPTASPTTSTSSASWPAGLVATVGYAGSRGHNLISAIEGNPVVPVILADGTTFFPAGAPRRNPAFGTIDYRTNGGRSTYNSLQAQRAEALLRARYQLQASYTLEQAMDNLQAQLAADANNSSVYPQNPYDREVGLGARRLRRAPRADRQLRRGSCPAGWQPRCSAAGSSTASSRRAAASRSRRRSAPNWSRSGNTSRPGSPEPEARHRSRDI